MVVKEEPMARTLQARFPGTCIACGGSIARGERVNWGRGRGVWHLTERQIANRPSRGSWDDPIGCTTEDSTLGPCGCNDYHYADCPTRGGAADSGYDEMWYR